MRLAIVAASSYEENGQVAQIPNAELDVELFGGRLAEADAGFTVHGFPAQRGLAEGIEHLLQGLSERPEALVFYFWGYALLSAERGPTLLLDGPKLSSFSFARLRRLLAEAADVSLVVLDASLAEGSHGEPLDAIRAMGSALSGGDSTVSSLIAVRPPQQRVPSGPPPFTGLMQMILDTQTGSSSALTPDSLFRAMQAEEVMFADITAAGCFLGTSGFELVPAAAPLSLPPPPVAVPAADHYEDHDEVTAPRAEVAPVRRAAAPPPPPPPPILRSVEREVREVAELPELPASEAAAYCRRLLGECERAGDRDGAYRAAVCLEVLGEADINESLLATTHRPEGLQAVRGALSYGDWTQRLSVGCGEPATTAVLRALGPALARVGFQYARRMRREPLLPDDARQDPEKSTATLAKALHWTTRVLAVGASELYVLPEVPGSLASVPGPERPIITCARALGSGLSLPELACLWARELSFLRTEESALCYFPDVEELSHLLRASLALGGALNLRTLDADSKRLSSQLKREVRGPSLDALQTAARAFPLHELDARVRAFVQSAELVAGRAALVACGDLELTLALEQRFPRAGLTRAEERRADLLHFMVSPELGQIRSSLGVSLA